MFKLVPIYPQFVVTSNEYFCYVYGPFRSYKDACAWSEKHDADFAGMSIYIIPARPIMPSDYKPSPDEYEPA